MAKALAQGNDRSGDIVASQTPRLSRKEGGPSGKNMEEIKNIGSGSGSGSGYGYGDGFGN